MRVIRYRRKNLISVGDAGDKVLLQRMRAQGNCAEYAPIGILLVLIAEIQNAPPVVLHIMGLMLVGGRIAHAIGFSRHPQIMKLRVLGMILTLMMITISSLGLVLHAIF